MLEARHLSWLTLCLCVGGMVSSLPRSALIQDLQDLLAHVARAGKKQTGATTT